MKKAADNQDIYHAIYEVVRQVPKGRVTSYGAVAKAVGLKSGARMVGRAMGLSMRVKPPIPVQRVVNSSGMLSGDNGYRKKKLESEGLKITGNKIVNYKTVFWDPMIEINL